MKTNNLIIGLGGCGGRSIQEFRRTVVKRQKEFDSLRDKGLAIDYLYIDSGDDILTSSSWYENGKDVRLSHNDIILLDKAKIRKNLDEISQEPNIAPWIGDMEGVFQKKIQRNRTDCDPSVMLRTLSGSAQLRRYGRALFAEYADYVRAVLRNKLQDMIGVQARDISFHIFTSLGGGTGSGCLIDMVTLIRHICEQMRVRASITVYAYVGGPACAAVDAGSFYENQYCTLRDLNALMVGAYHPHNIWEPDSGSCQFPETINRVYLSTDLAPGGASLPDQIKTVVKACCDSIVYGQYYSNPDCLRAMIEDDVASVVPGEPDASGNVVRSYRFATLGVKTMRYPSAEIRDYLFSRIEVSVWKNILAGSRLPRGCNRKLASPGGYCFTYRQTRTFELYQQQVSEVLAPLEKMYNEMSRDRVCLPHALKELHDLSEKSAKAAEELSRNANFMKAVYTSIDCTVRELESHLIRCLAQVIDWHDGGDCWGLEDLFRYLRSLWDEMSGLIDEVLPNWSDEEIDKDGVDIRNNMCERAQEGAKVGFLTNLLTTRSKTMLSDQYADGVKLVKTYFTRLHVHVLRELVERILGMLDDIMKRIDTLITGVSRKLSLAEQRYDECRNTLHACRGINDTDVCVFDEQLIDSVALAIEENAGLLEKFIPEIVASISSSAGSTFDDIIRNPSILIDSRPMSQSVLLLNILLQICSAASLPCPLGGNIADELVRMGGENPDEWDARLGRFIRDFTHSVHLISGVEARGGLVVPLRAPLAAFVVGLPHFGAENRLGLWLRQQIEQSFPLELCAYLKHTDFYESPENDEIRILYVAYWMPCRFMPVTKYSEDCYRQSLEEKRTDIVYFANIDASGEDESAEFSRPPLTC